MPADGLMEVAGAGIVDHVCPASSAWAIVPDVLVPHPSTPRTQPSVGDANVTERAWKPAGTAAFDDDGEAEELAEGNGGGGLSATAVGGALWLELGVVDDVAAGGSEGVAAGLAVGVGRGADGMVDVVGFAKAEGLGDGVALGEAPQPATRRVSRSVREWRVVLMALGRLRITMCSPLPRLAAIGTLEHDQAIVPAIRRARMRRHAPAGRGRGAGPRPGHALRDLLG